MFDRIFLIEFVVLEFEVVAFIEFELLIVSLGTVTVWVYQVRTPIGLVSLWLKLVPFPFPSLSPSEESR